MEFLSQHPEGYSPDEGNRLFNLVMQKIDPQLTTWNREAMANYINSLNEEDKKAYLVEKKKSLDAYRDENARLNGILRESEGIERNEKEQLDRKGDQKEITELESLIDNL